MLILYPGYNHVSFMLKTTLHQLLYEHSFFFEVDVYYNNLLSVFEW